MAGRKGRKIYRVSREEPTSGEFMKTGHEEAMLGLL
jgi:hypothetical protein